MKNLYLAFACCLLSVAAAAQESNSISLQGTCLNPAAGTISFVFDLSLNCPEADPNGILPGRAEMGFHSGANDWSTVVNWDAANAVTLTNNGNDSFLVTIHTLDYWGVALEDLSNVKMVVNDGIANPADPWSVALRDSLNGGFGGDEPCSDLRLIISETPTCADLNQESSLALFSDAADANSCLDADNGQLKIELDYALACPEGDPTMALAAASALGFHSGANDWAQVVGWDAPGAVQLASDGNGNFTAAIDLAAYYGIPAAEVTNIKFVANNGPDNPADPWSVAFRDPRNGGFGGNEPCSDLVLILAEVPACQVSDTRHAAPTPSLHIAPNPFDEETLLTFDNPNRTALHLSVLNLAGQQVLSVPGITGQSLRLRRDGWPAGLYFANLTDEQGRFTTVKLVVR